MFEMSTRKATIEHIDASLRFKQKTTPYSAFSDKGLSLRRPSAPAKLAPQDTRTQVRLEVASLFVPFLQPFTYKNT